MRWVAVVLLSGCSSILGIDDFKVAGDGGGGEMGSEMGYCLGPTGWRVCVPTMPTEQMPLSSNLQFSTTEDQSSPLCARNQPPSWKAAGQPDACFIIAGSVTFSAAMLQAVGDRPLVVFASDTITVERALDVASHSMPMSVGASSPSSRCTLPQPAGNGSTAPGAGAAGGSFMGKGGDGGNSTSSGIVGGRAAAADAQPPTLLRAGCAGGAGGSGGEMGGAGGAGGGAVYLVAGNRIVINGFINVSGSAGQGGRRNAGGGGGGSGGMIHLHAPMIGGNAGVLVANGGGGGEGGDQTVGGEAGRDPNPQMPSMIPLGGNFTGNGGPGGNGAAGTTLATSGGAGAAGAAPVAGGGGGGGAGYIRVNVMPSSQVSASPSVSLVP